MTLPETLNTHSIPGSLSSLKFPCTDFWLTYLGMLFIIFLSPIRIKLTCLVHYFTPTPRWETTASQTELQNPMAEGASERWLKCEGSGDGNDPEQVLGLSLMKGWHCCDCNNNVLLFWREREEAAQQAALSVGCSEGGEEGKQSRAILCSQAAPAQPARLLPCASQGAYSVQETNRCHACQTNIICMSRYSIQSNSRLKDSRSTCTNTNS